MDTKEEVKKAARDEREPGEIRQEIERTREEMGDTIDEIRERLSSEHIKGRIREETVGRGRSMWHRASEKTRAAGSTVAEEVRSNQAPYIMMGLGLGVAIGGLSWLMKRREGDGYGELPEIYPESEKEFGTEGLTGGYRTRAQQMAEEARGRLRGGAERMSGAAREKAGELRRRTMERSQYAKGRFQDMMQSNPVALGAACFAVGAIAGLAIPPSQAERQWMGEPGRKLMEEAERKVEEAAEKAEREM
jgi:hypothetical protein